MYFEISSRKTGDYVCLLDVDFVSSTLDGSFLCFEDLDGNSLGLYPMDEWFIIYARA